MEEKKLSRYIDELNAGKKPKEHNNRLQEEGNVDWQLLETVRKVRSLRDIEYPEDLFQQRLVQLLTGEAGLKKYKNRKYAFIYTTAAAAALILLLVTTNHFLPNKGPSIVYAMENAMEKVQAYHGIIEVSETNELGDTITQSKREVWADKSGNYYIKELEGTSMGLITVNNGEQKWQLRPEEKTVYLLPAFPDTYGFTFELGNEINDVTKALTVKKVGLETVSGRKTTKLQITPDGGETYYLWVDNETDLPLQRVSAMQNAIQVKVVYSSIEIIDEMPQSILAYEKPYGYTEIDTNHEQVVTSLEEAEELIGFMPKLPKKTVEEYKLDKVTVEKDKKAVKLYYSTTDSTETILLTQVKRSEKLAASSQAILGTVNNNEAEIITTEPTRSLRWQERGVEYCVLGTTFMEKLISFTEGLSGGKVEIPESSENAKEPQIKVEVDRSVEENEQKSVDAGHSPWRLDPVYVTQVFASLLLSPEGIVGDYPVAYENIEIIFNNGKEAIAKIKEDRSVAKYVYLKRLVRQDDTGIWTVVGYDPS